MTARRTFIPLALLATLPSLAHSQRVTGKVTNIQTGAPVIAVQVQLVDYTTKVTVGTVRTDSAGRFSVRAPKPGMYRVKYQRVGYVPVTSVPLMVTTGEDAAVSIGIKPDVATIDAITTTAVASVGGPAFEERRALAMGRFITRSDIQAQKYIDVPAVFNDVAGIRLSQDPQTRRWSAALRGQANCPPSYFLNGQRLSGLRGQYNSDAADLIFTTPVDIVWAIEIYASLGSIPALFASNGDGQCGVIALWTHKPG